MVHLQASGANRDTPNQNLLPDAPSFTPAPRRRGGGGGFRRNGIRQTNAPMVAELSRETLKHMFTAEETKITDFEHLASYNWLDERYPTIAVPGVPSLLDASSTAVKVKPDLGKYFVDQNAARIPDSPLEPLFRSLFTLKPDYDVSAIDLVSDRNNIRKLLKFVSRGSFRDTFEIKVEIVGDKTLLFTRVEPRTEIFSNGKEGFGHNFEDAVTTSVIGKGHHRIASYHLGGLKIINRSECDGYLKDETGPQDCAIIAEITAESHATASQPGGNPLPVARQTTPEISNLLNDLSISTPLSTNGNSLAGSKWAQPSLLATNSSRYVPPAQRGVLIKLQGTSIPTSQVLEIKTRASSKGLKYSDIVPQMWVSQTPRLVAGYFDADGWFKRIECNDMTSKIQEWEKNNENSIQQLVALIKWIRENVQNVEGKRGTVRFDGGNVIKIMGLEPEATALEPHLPGMRMALNRTAMRGRALPDDLYAKWGSTDQSQHARTEANEQEIGEIDGEDNGGVSLS
ncbi:putative geranylgeranyl pyrophosphate synthetase protein [Venturia nashicola]|uniref:Putative geranylgeranyl pyrophosphate synthetase protein n=1 Tax=Venturia nashicola TaxID=86259 RepID=A0A4Z1NS59_9PEZI|nr:putative geranylgeranyl pyrophosphate synthetase protein [Venturia nashicola]TLD28090.1 putative geranylgeranyl pyrophosphate synthetase protein [Venturia nashicola]